MTESALVFSYISVRLKFFLYHQQESVAAAVGELDVLLFQLFPPVLALLVLLLLLLVPGLLLLLLLLPLEVLGRLQARQRPPALHLLGAQDGEPGARPVLGHVNGALSGRLRRPHHVVETQLYGAWKGEERRTRRRRRSGRKSMFVTKVFAL